MPNTMAMDPAPVAEQVAPDPTEKFSDPDDTQAPALTGAAESTAHALQTPTASKLTAILAVVRVRLQLRNETAVCWAIRLASCLLLSANAGLGWSVNLHMCRRSRFRFGKDSLARNAGITVGLRLRALSNHPHRDCLASKSDSDKIL